MRSSWRHLLLVRSKFRPYPPTLSRFSSQPNEGLTAIPNATTLPSQNFPNYPNFQFQYPMFRNFSSEPTVDVSSSDHVIVADIFGKVDNFDEIKKGLDDSGITVSRDLVLKVLESVRDCDDVARRFFRWVLEGSKEKVCSKGYNLMLEILGRNGDTAGFWQLYEDMKNKGYGVSKHVRDSMLERCEKDGLVSDVEKLKELFSSGSVDKSPEKLASRVCKVVKSDVWSEDLERKLKEMDVEFCSEVVGMVIEKMSNEPLKALILFRWVEESQLFKHDAQTYNAMAVVLGREDCVDRFWKVANEMRRHGFEMEMETYAKVSGRFCKRKLIDNAIGLYEFAMSGKNKPSVNDTTYLLKKIVVGKSLDLGLFWRVIKVFTENGNQVTDSMVNAVLKSLSSVGRFGMSNNVLKVVEEFGFVTGSNLRSKMLFQLSSYGNENEANKLIKNVAASGENADHKSWMALIEGSSVSGDLEKASDYFRQMVEKEGGLAAAAALESLIGRYCNSKRAADAYQLLRDCVSRGELKPSHVTYKLLIKRLLGDRDFDNALSLLGMMKSHGYPPFLDPLFHHISRNGNGDNAIAFMKAVTSKKYPSTSVFLQMFEAFFKANRLYEAQDFLSKCPRHIRDHADVLNLFCSKSRRNVAAKPATVEA